MKYKVQTIKWWDATSVADWVAIAALPGPSPITTTGYVVRESKTSITICGSIGETEVGDCITIPAPWIKVRKNA